MTEKPQNTPTATDPALAERHARFDEQAGLLRETAGTICSTCCTRRPTACPPT